MTENETPLKLCKKWSKMAPGCFDTLDLLCKESHEDMGVSNVCDLPIGAAYEYLRVKCHLEKDGRARLASELTGLYIWRKHKVIYNFDHTLAQELVAQADAIAEDDKIPTEILLRPPYPCVYIQTDKPLAGDSLPLKFMAWIEEDANSHVREFRVQPFADNMEHTKTFMLELTKPTVYECIYDTVATTARYNSFAKFQLNNIRIDESVRAVLRAMQLYLYVCSDQADIRENPKQKGIYRPRQPGQPIKDKFREIDMKDVGVVIGHTLRRAEQESSAPQSNPSADEAKQGSHKRPHTRRGHWHHYWTGSKSEPEQRKLILKWTHPMLIGGYTDNVVTMFPVKE